MEIPEGTTVITVVTSATAEVIKAADIKAASERDS